jgi:hypothetical protein
VIYRGGNIATARGQRLGPGEVLDAEATGALEGLKQALHISSDRHQRVHICLDNTSAISAFQGRPADSSQAVFLQFQDLAKGHRNIKIRWCPGHEGITGNELADRIAKAACSQALPSDAIHTLAAATRLVMKENRQLPHSWWYSNCPDSYQRYGLEMTAGKPPEELQLSRRTLHHLLAARSGHGDFADYHERFAHADVQDECPCGGRTSQWHIIRCRLVPQHTRATTNKRGLEGVFQMLGSEWTAFAKMVENLPACLRTGTRW